MAFKQWMDNAFWENSEKDKLNCILEIQDDAGREERHVMMLNKTDQDGNPNPVFEEVISALGEESIDNNTEERKVRKAAEKEEQLQRDEEHARARKLEKLFNYKLEMFETEEIKNSKNRKLKAKIRRSKSQLEAIYYALKLLEETYEEELENGGEE